MTGVSRGPPLYAAGVARGEHGVPVGAVVRVWDAHRQVVGGGFLVGPGIVATCAHVVADAVAADPYRAAAPSSPVRVDFPLLDPLTDGDGRPPDATGTVERWLPISEDGTGDVALLRLDGPLPEQARMPPLRRVERLWDHGFRVLGFPDGAWDGVWATGRIRGEQGTGWFQLQGNPGEQPVEGGFSGAPVWDDDSGAVVGMTVAADRGGTATAYLVPIDEVLGVDPELLPCPYRGLAPFDEEHAEHFFGRGPDVERLVDAVDRLPVVAVAGPSGVGKSSLVRAGLVPRLRASGVHVLEVPAVPGSVVPALPATVPAPTVLLVDQFEELAALDPPAARELLQEIVARTAAEADLRAVLTVRWSALDDLLTPDLAAVLEAGTVLVAPLDRGRLRETIVGPAERAPGLAFEDGLVERILDDAGSEPGRLPLVESLLAQLWERREGGYLTLGGYAAAGGVAGSVAQHAERVVAGVEAGDDMLRRLFTLLARPDRDGRFVRHPVPMADLPDELAEHVPALVAGRLLVLGRAGRDTVELAHQALIEHWPRLRAWLAADREFLAWRAGLGAQRERWESAGRDHGALLRGTALAAAGEWLPARSTDVPAADRDYLRRSTQRQRREVRRWRLVTAVLAVIVLVAGAFATVATQRGTQLATQLATANADALGRESATRSTSDAAVAAQLALAAWRSDPQSPQARTALAKSYLAMQSVEAEFPDIAGGPVASVAAMGDVTLVWSRGRRSARRHRAVRARSPAVGAAGRQRGHPDRARTRRRQARGRRTGRRPAVGHRDRGARADAPGGRAGARARLLPRWRAAGVDGRPRRRGVGARGRRPHDRDRAPAPPGTGAAAGAHGVLAVPRRDERRPALRPERAALLGPRPTRPTAWSCARSSTGRRSAQLPPDVRVLGGAARWPAHPRRAGAGPGPHRQPDRRGRPAARDPGVRRDASCSDIQLTADLGAVVETDVGDQDRDQDVVWLTDLADGRTYQLAVPRPANLPAALTGRVTVDPTITMVRRPGGPPEVLKAHGTSVLRLRTEPMRGPAVSGRLVWDHSEDGRYAMVLADNDVVFVEDRASGSATGSRPLPTGDDGRHWFLQDALWVTQRSAGGWEVTRYELPDLAETLQIALPSAGEDGRPHLAGLVVDPAGGPLIALSDGILTAWDGRTGQRLGGPTTIPSPPDRPDWFRSAAVAWPRPAHPGQLAVLAPGGAVQLWDAVAGTQLATIPAEVENLGPVAFDATGDRLAALTPSRTIVVWDMDARAPVRAPIPAPSVGRLLGFDSGGQLVARTLGGSDRLTLLDVDRGIATGSLGVAEAVNPPEVSAGTVTVGGLGTALPQEVALTAEAWFARLCARGRPPLHPGRARAPPAGNGPGAPVLVTSRGAGSAGHATVGPRS